MASFVFNVAKGRTTEFHERVNNNDPANSALIIVVLAEAGLETDDVLKDYNTLAAIVPTNDEVDNTNYARKVLTDADLAPATIDDVDDQVELTFGTQTFTSIAAGDSWRKLLVCYDADTTGGTDSDIIPVSAHDLLISGVAVVPTGSNIVVSLPSGYVIAT